MQLIISIILGISAVFGVVILKTDGYLWAAAPSHAYGLIVFVILDVALAVALWRIPRLAIVGAALLGFVQLAAMVGDIFVGQPYGLSTKLWEEYLLGDTYFVVLLCIQPFLVAAGALALTLRRRSGSTIFGTLRK
jgi:hypothetical protein